MRICIIIWIVFDLDVDQIDIESAFLEGQLKPSEYMYMKAPQGFGLKATECVMIKKGMYGLKNTGRIYYYTMRDYLCSTKGGFKVCPTDQCLFYKQGKHNIVMIICWVDDSICFGHKEDIADVISFLNERFTVKTEGGLNDFLGCEILMDKTKSRCWLVQPHLIRSLIDKYGKSQPTNRVPLTPGTPGLILHKLKSNDDYDTMLETNEQKLLQSGTGSLIYILKHSRPELSNSIRELTKGMQQGGKKHLQEMYRIMRYIINTKYQALMIEPKFTRSTKPIEWIITIATDATSGQIQLEGQSVLGVKVYLMNTLIIWKSKTSNLVTLSSTEAEVHAAVEGIKEALTVKDILEWMGQTVQLPMKLYIDNIPALNIIRNNYTTKRTKHAAIRQWYAKEQFQLGNITPVHKRGIDLTADILTKNLNSADFHNKSRSVTEVPNEYLDKCRAIIEELHE